MNTAEMLTNHILSHCPSCCNFRIADIYKLGQILSGEGIGRIISFFIISSWKNNIVPIIAVNDTYIDNSVILFINSEINAVSKSMRDSNAIYWVNVFDSDTKVSIKDNIDYKNMWILDMSNPRKEYLLNPNKVQRKYTENAVTPIQNTIKDDANTSIRYIPQQAI